MKLECKLKSIKLPKRFEKTHIYIKSVFANRNNQKPRGLNETLNRLSIDYEGTPHRGIDDAKNMAKIAMKVLKL